MNQENKPDLKSPGAASDSLLAEKLLVECQRMATFAIENGLKLPPKLVDNLTSIQAGTMAFKKKLEQLTASQPPTDPKTSFIQQLENLKTEFSTVQSQHNQDLTRLHTTLVDLVAPATPKSIKDTTYDDKKDIPFVKTLRNLSISLLSAYIIIGIFILFGFVSEDIKRGLEPLYILIAAGLGASFYALYTANRYVVARTFDEYYKTFYWTRLALGMIAGYILSLIIAPGEIDTQSSLIKQITPSLVALLGGYSAEAVNQILRRLVEMLITLVKGDAQAIVKAREEEIKARLAAQMARQRLESAAELVKLSEQLDAKKLDQAKELLQKMIDKNLELF